MRAGPGALVWPGWPDPLVAAAAGGIVMSEFLQNYGFFILVAVLMALCHLGHAGHGRSREDDRDKRSGPGGHQH